MTKINKCSHCGFESKYLHSQIICSACQGETQWCTSVGIDERRITGGVRESHGPQRSSTESLYGCCAQLDETFICVDLDDDNSILFDQQEAYWTFDRGLLSPDQVAAFIIAQQSGATVHVSVLYERGSDIEFKVRGKVKTISPITIELTEKATIPSLSRERMQVTEVMELC